MVTISLCDKINNSSKFISEHLLTQFDHVQSVVGSNNSIASMQNVPFIVSMQMNTVFSTLHIICRSISVKDYRTRDYFNNRNLLGGEGWFFFSLHRLKWQYTNVCLMRVTSHWQKCFIYITASIHSALIGSRPQLDNYLHGPQRSVVCIEITSSPTPEQKKAAYPLNKVNQTLSK